MMSNIPTIKPIKLKEYEVKQSKYDNVPKLPARAMILAPSGSGKSILIQNMILDIYKGCFNRIYIISSSINSDHTWQPVKKYIKDEIRPNEKEKIYFEDYDPDELEKIIKTQQKVIEYLKDKNEKKLFQILIVLDDVIDNPQLCRHSKLLEMLYCRGRHLMISTITSTQTYKAINPICRKNVLDLFIFKLRNQADLDAVMEELSALASKKDLIKIYKDATDEPYSFLYISLASKTIQDMFFNRFKKIEWGQEF